MKPQYTIFLFVLTLSLVKCTTENTAASNNAPSHDIKRIVCSAGLSMPHHIEIQSDGHIIYKGMNDFYDTDEQYQYNALYVGKIEDSKFNEIAEKLVSLNYLELNDYKLPENNPTPGNYLHAHIYHSDTVKFLSHFNDSITELLIEILELRKDGGLKLTIKNTDKLFETEIPSPPFK